MIHIKHNRKGSNPGERGGPQIISRFRSWCQCFLMIATALGGVCALAGEPLNLSPQQTSVLTFLKENLPGIHQEVLVIKQHAPNMVDRVLGEALAIKDTFERYRDMDGELGQIYLRIKRREYQNRLISEKILATPDPQEQKRLFTELHSFMNDTFELNLKLVRGELQWLEQQVTEVRSIIQEEKDNKPVYMKEDLENYLLSSQTERGIGFPDQGAAKLSTAQQQAKKLIEELPDR